ncbi:phosphoribosyltransferase [Aquisalimonas sp.]|uniref:phosphoribosyltransferase n=1 Tax=unclassified Aquisalimonas TaxID=2644645 RepID=UPI0025C2ECCD|nr:phosphoribosyltransferase family protein [Aquisalimonas sp.]
MFRDRIDAARQLAERLRALAPERPLILGVPRGGVPMASVIARTLGGDLDVVLVRKIPAPRNPEYAIGAVNEDGEVSASPHTIAHYGDQYVQRAARQEAEMLRHRRAQYTPARPPLDPAGRVVVVVDDGSATGATIKAALKIVRQRQPARLVVALGAAPPDVVRALKALADEVHCVIVTPDFGAVGQFYADFRQVSDDEVIALLRDSVQASREEGGGRQEGAE